MAYVRAPIASKYYGVQTQTLRSWARTGKVETTTTKGGHYRYKCEGRTVPVEVENLNRKKIIYARVSTRKQLPDLQNQINFLQEKYPGYVAVTDVGSGVNFERHGLKRILKMLFAKNLEEVVVAHKDRFARIGFEFFQWLFSQFGATLRCLETSSNAEQDVSQDILEILTHFTATYYGKRKYQKKKSVEETKESEEASTAEEDDDSDEENKILPESSSEEDD